MSQFVEEKSEKKLRWFLNQLEKNVFVKSINSTTGEEEKLSFEILDMEATIRINGEWDREDLKSILYMLYLKFEANIFEELKKGLPTRKQQDKQIDFELEKIDINDLDACRTFRKGWNSYREAVIKKLFNPKV